MQTKTLMVLGAFAFMAIATGAVKYGFNGSHTGLPIVNEVTTDLSNVNSQEATVSNIASSTSTTTSASQ